MHPVRRLPAALTSTSSRIALALMLGGSVASVALTGAALVGCDNEQPKTALGYTADAKRAYEAALQEFNAHNWLESQALMREVKRKYSYSKYARLAELRIADADYEQEKFAEAIREYRQFVHDHRSDADEVSYARSRIAEAQYAQISESLLLPSADERDQAVIMDAFKELKSFVHDYPNAKESKKIRELLADVTARLMRHELYVARFYLQRDNFEAAVLRIQYAMRTFAAGPQIKEPTKDTGKPAAREDAFDSGLEAEALLLLGEVYLKMHRFPDARESFVVLVRDYPRSPLTLQANNYLSYMKERGV
ncbi:MAG: Competence protein ComL precursor [Labilithrix sp.]|nr:Competence protein ComL precursor [Labilithrix sp.]